MGITPTLLLIVPTLNSYKVLPRLINSLKSQIFVDWSLLLVDGPSNNDHKLYLDNCCKNDKRINYIISIELKLTILFLGQFINGNGSRDKSL